MARHAHPIEDIELVIKYAEAIDWAVCHDSLSTHCWGRLYCNTSKSPNSVISIWLQPPFPLMHAKQIIKNLRQLNVKRRTSTFLTHEEKQTRYSFTVQIKNIHSITNELEDNIIKSHCHDALLHAVNDAVYLHFTRVANNLEEAVNRVIDHLEPLGYQIEMMYHHALAAGS